MRSVDGQTRLITYDVSCRMRLYDIRITWDKPAEVDPPPNQIPMFTPSLCIRQVKVEDDCLPLQGDHDTETVTFNDHIDNTSRSSARLSHLQLLSPSFDPAITSSSSPFVLAIFTYVPPPSENGVQIEKPHSIISRWKIVARQEILHSAFDSLSVKKSSIASSRGSAVSAPLQAPTCSLMCDVQNVVDLLRLEDKYLDGAVMHAQGLDANRILGLASNDGSLQLEFWENDQVEGLLRLRGDAQPSPTTQKEQSSYLREADFDFGAVPDGNLDSDLVIACRLTSNRCSCCILVQCLCSSDCGQRRKTAFNSQESIVARVHRPTANIRGNQCQ